jgi:Site-specific recombinase XerD
MAGSEVGGRGFKLGDVPPLESLVDAVERAYRDVEKGRYRLRDLALVAVLTFTGCRLGEALALRREDVDVKNRTIRIRQLKKRGEFSRVVPVPSRLFWEIMERYLRKNPGDRLFEISDRQARNIVYKFTARYLKKKIRPHAIRHAYAIAVLKKTKDLEAVRRLLGHADYKHLKHYLNYTQEDLEEELRRVFEGK